jgi:HPt (histidine-containing phosphotransfer) domain-containing protein
MAGDPESVEALTEATARLKVALERLNRAVAARGEGTSRAEAERLRGECDELRAENLALRQRLALSEARCHSLEDRHTQAAGRLDEVIGSLRRALAR